MFSDPTGLFDPRDIFGGVWGFVKGAANAGWNALTSTASAITGLFDGRTGSAMIDATKRALGYVSSHSVFDMWADANSQVAGAWDQYVQAGPERRGELLGGVAFNLAAAALPGGLSLKASSSSQALAKFALTSETVSPELMLKSIISSAGTKFESGPTIALGLTQVGSNKSALLQFAKSQNAVMYEHWADVGVVSQFGFSPSILSEALSESGKIKFCLDGIVQKPETEAADVLGALEEGSKGLLRDSEGRLVNITNHELYTVMSDPDLLAKTEFYYGGGKYDPAKK